MPKTSQSPELPKGGFTWGQPARYGQLRVVAKSSQFLQRNANDRGAQVEAVSCPATYEFVIPDTGVTGRFQTTPIDGSPGLASIMFQAVESPMTAADLESLGGGLFRALLQAAEKISIEVVDRADNGALTRVHKPTGGRGKGRISNRPWNHPDEIQRTLDLMSLAEQRFAEGSMKHFDTKLKREAWVAQQTHTWSPGTVHLQLQIARNQARHTEKEVDDGNSGDI